MGKLANPPKIRTEDFDQEDRAVAEKVGSAFNSFVDQVYQILSGGIDYDNLKRQISTLDIITDSAGKAINPPSIKYNIPFKLRAVTVLTAINTVNVNSYPLSHPFISWTMNGSQVVILNITGLPPSSQFKLTVELIT